MAPGTAVRDTETVLTSTPVRTTGESSAARPRWWRRVWRSVVDTEPNVALQALRLEALLALLTDAREQLDTGWLQGSWWSIRTTAGERRVVTSGFAAATTPPHQIIGACLVGALVQAGTRQTPGAHSEIAAAVDIVYEALWESSDGASAPIERGLPKLTAPRVRLARVQALARWNDRPQRTHAEVLQLVDGAIARTIQGIVALPKDSPA